MTLRKVAPLLVVAMLVAAAAPARANPGEAGDLRRRVERLESRIAKLSKGQLKKFYAVRYRDSDVRDVRHECYIALLDHVTNRSDNKQRNKDLKFIRNELHKLRAGYGKLVKLSAEDVEACELRRTPMCEPLRNLPDSTESRYYRSEIDVMRDDERQLMDAIKAHERLAAKSLQDCKARLAGLP